MCFAFARLLNSLVIYGLVIHWFIGLCVLYSDSEICWLVVEGSWFMVDGGLFLDAGLGVGWEGGM
ncbi:predicted protein [Sclerotinia sclerotiorum 1980 UF-70]|uniref:Uncharacterized protein n=1 Tax=Sclerotinia sclerotiorum (strain ATCC 18683 / 1980 / Ss-1) TaxID=665079 RepID=A7E5W9_SCLS1|nr:predicted protein [Sclerotinia sclerotiorum 1980 UF-70]EDN91291.1 predicted protein [Sclerotinia sclerotiorum 1980 UF-70]